MLIKLKLSLSITGAAKGIYIVILHLSNTISQYFHIMQSMPYVIYTVKHSEKLKLHLCIHLKQKKKKGKKKIVKFEHVLSKFELLS